MKLYFLPWREYAKMNLSNQLFNTQENNRRISSKYFIGDLECHINNDSMCAKKITESILNKYFKNIKFQNKVHFVLGILVKTSS